MPGSITFLGPNGDAWAPKSVTFMAIADTEGIHGEHIQFQLSLKVTLAGSGIVICSGSIKWNSRGDHDRGVNEYIALSARDLSGGVYKLETELIYNNMTLRSNGPVDSKSINFTVHP